MKPSFFSSITELKRVPSCTVQNIMLIVAATPTIKEAKPINFWFSTLLFIPSLFCE